MMELIDISFDTEKGLGPLGDNVHRGLDEAPHLSSVLGSLGEAVYSRSTVMRAPAPRVAFAFAALAAMAALNGLARAQEHYPSRPIMVVVPITAGTTIDILARLYGESLSKRFGQQVIIANRPGAGGLIGAQAAASAPADGYTLLLANSGHAILGTLNKSLPFDPVADFAGSLIADAPTFVTVAPSLGAGAL